MLLKKLFACTTAILLSLLLARTVKAANEVHTLPATDITANSATLHGTVGADDPKDYCNCGAYPCYYGFVLCGPDGCHSRTFGTAAPNQSFSGTWENLIPGTGYRVVAELRIVYEGYCCATVWGEVLTFTTLSLPPPSVSTGAATSISQTSATLWGRIENDGGQSCQYRFRYKESGDSYSYTSWTGSVTTGQSFSEPMSGLTPGSTYYFNAQGKNSAGESAWGNEQSFVTEPEQQPPVASFIYLPEKPMVGKKVEFDASGSYDPDGTIITYQWDFGDSSSSEGKYANHTYTKTGEYTVTLTVTDNDGLTGSTSQSITVGRPTLKILKARMVSPNELGIDVEVSFPKNAPKEARRKVKFWANINDKDVTDVCDITLLIGPGESKEIHFDDEPPENPVPSRIINFNNKEVPRFKENVTFTLYGVAYWEGGLESEPNAIKVEISLPVIILHGYTYTHEWPFMHMLRSVAYWELIWALKQSGYTTDPVWYRTLWGPDDCAYEADKLTERDIYLLVDSWVVEAFQKTYASRVNLVCHSTGGLVARYYAGQVDKVNKLIMIATPHLGLTRFYEFTFDKVSKDAADKILRVRPNDLLSPQNLLRWFEPNYGDSSLVDAHGEEVREPYENNFNATDNRNVKYYNIYAKHPKADTDHYLEVNGVGDWYKVRGNCEHQDFGCDFGDGTVLELSAGSFGGSPITTRTEHQYLCNDPTVRSRVIHILSGKQEVSSEYSSSTWHTGDILPSQSTFHVVSIDPKFEKADFTLTWQGSNLNLTLCDPTGREINPAVASTDPNIDFIEGDTYEQYSIETSEKRSVCY